MKRNCSTAYPVQLNLWDRVCIVLQKNGDLSEFASRVEDIKQGSYFLEMPIRQNGMLNLSKGDIVKITYNKADSIYTFKTSIMDLFEEDGSVEIEKAAEATRVQRREFIRIDISGKMSFRALDNEDGKDAGLGPETHGTLLNISAGGLLFESSESLKEGSLILLSFTLKSRHALKNILATIKRCEGSKSKGYLIGAEFITRSNYKEYGLEKLDEFLPPGCGTFDENLQKLVLRFIYDQQIEAKKKNQQ